MQSQASVSPYRKLYNVTVGAVAWTKGFWTDRFAVCREVMIPNMWELLNQPTKPSTTGSAENSWYTNFLIAANLKEGEYNGCPFSDGDFYKWLEAVAYVYGVTHEARLDQWMDEIVAVLAQAQRADGYLHTPVLIKQRRGEPDGREFADRLDFEMYNFGHLMTTAVVHYQATGKTTLLAIAEKLSDYLAAAFEHPTPESAQNSICPAHYMGLIDLYRTTGDQKHLHLLKTLIDMRTLIEGGSDDNQDRIPFQMSEVVIPQDIALTPQRGEGVLKDIVVLKGRADLVAAGDWSRQLYREFRPQPAKSIDVTFIPYYAWDNRGLSEMTVWMPVR